MSALAAMDHRASRRLHALCDPVAGAWVRIRVRVRVMRVRVRVRVMRVRVMRLRAHEGCHPLDVRDARRAGGERRRERGERGEALAQQGYEALAALGHAERWLGLGLGLGRSS